MPAGTKVQLSGMDVEVLTATDEGWPVDVSFTFDKTLEDPSLVFYRFDKRGFVRFTPPSIGECQVRAVKEDCAAVHVLRLRLPLRKRSTSSLSCAYVYDDEDVYEGEERERRPGG